MATVDVTRTRTPRSSLFNLQPVDLYGRAWTGTTGALGAVCGRISWAKMASLS